MTIVSRPAGGDHTSASADDLYRKIFINTAARFHGAVRIDNRQKLSVFTSILMSFAVIVVAIFSITGQQNVSDQMRNLIDTLVIILSVGVIIFTSLESGFDFGKKAHDLRSTANELQCILAEFFRGEELIDENKREEVSKLYTNCLRASFYEHSRIDYIGFEIFHPDKFTKQVSYPKVEYFYLWMKQNIIYLLANALSTTVIVYAIFLAVGDAGSDPGGLLPSLQSSQQGT